MPSDASATPLHDTCCLRFVISKETMHYNINSEEEYHQVMERVENYLRKSTAQGGAHTLTTLEKKELQHLSLLTEAWKTGCRSCRSVNPRR